MSGRNFVNFDKERNDVWLTAADEFGLGNEVSADEGEPLIENDEQALSFERPWATVKYLRWLTLKKANVISALLHATAIALWFTIRFTTTDRVLSLPMVWTRPEYNLTLANEPIPFTNPPVNATSDTATFVYQVDELYRTEVYMYAVAFSAMSLLAHLYVLANYSTVYLPNLKLGRNPVQWIEYSFSASLMMVALSQPVGLIELRGVVLTAFLTAAVMTYGWVMEYVNPLKGNVFEHREIRWWPFVIGSIFFVPPWVFFFILIGQEDSVPNFVYAVLVVTFFNFLLFPLNQFLHYKLFYVKKKEPGPRENWASLSYARSQIVVQWLSWQAKFALPAIILFGSLRNLGPANYCGHVVMGD